MLWTQLLAETLNASMLEALRSRGHPDLRYSHGFNARFAEAPGAERVEAAAATLAAAMGESGALDAVRGRRVQPAQGLTPQSR